MAYDSDTGIIWGYTFGGDQFDVNTQIPRPAGRRCTLCLVVTPVTVPTSWVLHPSTPVAPVPEPSTWVLIGSALILFAASRRFKASRAA